MDPITIVGLVDSVISVGSAIRKLYGRRISYWRRRWRWAGQLYAIVAALSDSGVIKTHWDINCWNPQEVMEWRNSYISSCSAVAVAAAIFASIGLTALQLPNMYSTNWTARALLMSSMTFGILSAVLATSQLQAVAMLNDHMQVRLWLSRGRVNLSKREYDFPFRLLPLESSIARLSSIQMPQFFLKIAVFLYMVGFGLYFLFLWLEQADSDAIGDRNVFIVYIIILGLVLFYVIGVRATQFLEKEKINFDFDLHGRESFAKSKEYQQLETAIRKLEQLRGLDIEDKDEWEALQDQLEGVLDAWSKEPAEASISRSNKSEISPKSQRQRGSKKSSRPDKAETAASTSIQHPPETTPYSAEPQIV